MAKTRLINSLKETELNFKIGMAGLTVLNCNDIKTILTNEMMKVGVNQYNFDEIIKIFSDRRTAEIASNCYYAMLMRTAITEAYDMIKTYCDTQNLSSNFTNQPFHEICKLIRNTLSHSMVIEIKPNSSYKFPITWKEIYIVDHKQVSNKTLEQIGITPLHIFELLDEMSEFVKSKSMSIV